MLNSTLDDSEIIPFLDALVSAGYEGVCPHPRDGLRVPYASRVYWEKMDHIFKLCRERNLEIWHYDEFPFPSGMAGGLLPADDPSSVVRRLKFEEIEMAPNRDGAIEVGAEPLLALLRYRENEGGEKIDVRDATPDCGSLLDTWVWGEWHNRFYTGALNVHDELHERGCADRFSRAFLPQIPLEDGERLMAVKIEVAPGRVGLPGRPDVTRPEITDRFLNQIYTKLAELSRANGMRSTPVFQDEVTFGATWPWNEEIANRLRPLWGENFAAKIAALHAPSTPGWETARLEYRQACQDAFEKNWCIRVRDFCHKNDMQMTGHLAGEETLIGHCQLLGDAFKNLRHFDIPGYDIISSTISDDLNRSQQIGIKVVQSTAWLEGRKPTMVEVFGANGFHSDLQRQRNVLAWLGAHDFSQVFDHSAYQSTHSIRKYDAPPVSTRFNPLVAGREDLWNWHNWFADLMQEFSFAPRTLILFPVESLARYCADEIELWHTEVSFLETWFHYAFASSLDAIFLPTHFLDQVEAREDGFHFQGEIFENFIVPPLASLHENVWAGVLRLCNHPRFSWCSNHEKTVEVFGAQVDSPNHSNTEIIPAARVFTCDETDLLQQKSAWFDEIISTPLSAFETDVTLLKTVRKNANGEELIVLINTHDVEIEVRNNLPLGELVAQPPAFLASAEYSENNFSMRPREVLLFRQSEMQQPKNAIETRQEILPTDAKISFESSNFLSLKTGVLHLEGERKSSFAPAPVSGIWNLHQVQYADSDAVYAPPYSREKLPHPLKFEAEFTVVFSESLTDLTLLLDEDSMPPETVVTWSGEVLSPQFADVLDQNNTIFQIPVELLNAGTHFLKLESTVSVASQGLLERPILFGKFLADANAVLRAMPEESQSWNGETWPDLGIDEGFGPFDYEFHFQLDDAQAAKNWQLQLSPCIGVAQIRVNDEDLGRSSWEPRVLRAPGLQAGENRVTVRLYGSWNNLFSTLNHLKNGLTNVKLISE